MSESRNAASALASMLEELARLVEGMSEVEYIQRSQSGVSGSVGAHVRHCVDHALVVLDRCGSGVLSFDERRRGTSIEFSRMAGSLALRRCAARLLDGAMPEPDLPLVLDARLDASGGSTRVRSSVGREIVYVLQHTIHHNAVIALLLASRGRALPERFGYAPSTPVVPEPRAAAACVR